LAPLRGFTGVFDAFADFMIAKGHRLKNLKLIALGSEFASKGDKYS
jgi:hypothetical protein